jgi:UDP-glucose 4-epimerase
MPIALITGARGFIGKHLARSLSSTGQTVVGLGHGAWSPGEAASWGISHWLNGDIQASNLRSIQAAVGSPAVVYHLAGGSSVATAIANPREDFFRTVATTAELVEWLRLDAPTAHLVAISSAAVYGADYAGPIGEDSAPRPCSPYGAHKRLMEELCLSYKSTYGLRVSIARLFSVFGPGLRKQLLWDLCSRLASTEGPLVLGGTGAERRDWTDVRDVVRAIAALGNDPPESAAVFNVGTGVGTTVREVAAAVVRRYVLEPEPMRPLLFSGESRPGDPFSLVSKPGLLRSSGFEWAIPVATGIADYVEWFKQQVSASK